MEKKKYEKPVIEVVEVQLSECIAGSVQTAVAIEKGTKTNTTVRATGNSVSWDSSF